MPSSSSNTNHFTMITLRNIMACLIHFCKLGGMVSSTNSQLRAPTGKESNTMKYLGYFPLLLYFVYFVMSMQRSMSNLFSGPGFFKSMFVWERIRFSNPYNYQGNESLLPSLFQLLKISKNSKHTHNHANAFCLARIE